MRTCSGKSGKKIRHTGVLSPNIQNMLNASIEGEQCGDPVSPSHYCEQQRENRQQQSTDAAVQIKKRRVAWPVETADIEYVVVVGRDQRKPSFANKGRRRCPASPRDISPRSIR